MKQNTPEPLSVTKNTLWNSVGSLFYLACQWLVTVLVVVFSPDYTNSGALAFAMVTGILFSSIALYNIRPFQVSDLDQEYSNQNYVGFRIITILAAGIISITYTAIISDTCSLIITCCVYIAFKADEVFSDVIYGIDQRNARMDYIGLSQIFRGFLSLAGFGITLFFTGDLNLAILVMAIACMLVTVFHDIPHAKHFGPFRPSITRSKAASLAKTCFPAMIASTCLSAISTFVRQYFGLVYGEEALGIYAAIATPAVLIQVAAVYLYSPLIGELAKAGLKDKRHFDKLFLKISVLLICVTAVLVAALSLCGGWFLILIYGQSIADYAYIFPFVLIATGCVGFLFFVHTALVILRRFLKLFIADFLGLVCSLASAVFFVDFFGMNGVNYSIIFGAGIAIVLGFFFVFDGRKAVKWH